MNYKNPYDDFHRADYLQHNSSRHNHLDSLKLALENKTILEVGAGIGDHTEYLLKQSPHNILCLEAREENISILEERFNDNSAIASKQFDMDNPTDLNSTYDVCYCYGLLYHLESPENAIKFMAEHTKEILLLETCVDYTNENSTNLISEDTNLYSQSFTGTGCRPGRVWLFNTLKAHFDHVYLPTTQPNHKQFPTDWKADTAPAGLSRAVFIASKKPIANCNLTDEIPYSQTVINE